VKVRYAIEVDPAREPHARFALELLLEGIGLAGEFSLDVENADLVYAPERPSGKAVWIRSDPAGDWDAATARAGLMEGMPVLYRNNRPAVADTPGVIDADLIYSAYALVTGALERGQEKNPWGVPVAEGSFLLNEGVLSYPAVSTYANHLWEVLSSTFPGKFHPVPRWPDGKRYAVVISHDVDTPFTNPSRRLHFRMMLGHIRKSELKTADIYAKALTKQVLGMLPAQGRDDPNFRFADWLEHEGDLGARSCFYVAVRNSTEISASPQDVFYDFRHPDLVDALRQVTEAGWEVGLHASVNAWKNDGWFVEERELLQSVIPGYEVAGLRHHYWSMNGDAPEETLALHSKAGFHYDSSLGLNDAPGFRRGLAWPFNPFHRGTMEVLPIIEVPPTLMDGGIFYHDLPGDEAAGRIREHIGAAFEHGGAVVLDWHLEQLNPDLLQGAGTALLEVLREMRHDSDIYWAAPGEIAEWWSERRKRISCEG